MQPNLFFKALLLAAFLLPFYGHAQSDGASPQRTTYLFDPFIEGSVRLKNGALEQAPLNYDAGKQSVVYKKDGVTYELTALETVDTVYIGSKRFVPFNGLCYEVIAQTPVAVYATYSSKADPLAATAEHDRSVRREASQTSNTVSDVYVTRQYRGDYAMRFRKHYWVRKYKNVYKVDTEKQVLRAFPKNEQAIHTFIKEHGTDFNNEADLVKLLTFCSRL